MAIAPIRKRAFLLERPSQFVMRPSIVGSVGSTDGEPSCFATCVEKFRWRRGGWVGGPWPRPAKRSPPQTSECRPCPAPESGGRHFAWVPRPRGNYRLGAPL